MLKPNASGRLPSLQFFQSTIFSGQSSSRLIAARSAPHNVRKEDRIVLLCVRSAVPQRKTKCESGRQRAASTP